MAEGKEFFTVGIAPGGKVIGPQLNASLVVPYNMGLAFADPNGNFWQFRLAQNADGSLYVGPDGKPTVELIQVIP